MAQEQPPAHKPVLFDEVIENIVTDLDGCYLDGTFGRGGHSSAILARLSPNGRMLCFDQDHQAIAHGQQLFADEPRVTMCHQNFSDIQSVVKEHGLMGQISGILLDLGVSSPQLDEAERGFSFMRDGPLDMRMDQRQKLDAAAWIAHTPVKEMIKIFKWYGEEPLASRYAHKIDDVRQQRTIETTAQLADIISNAQPKSKYVPGKHAATRVFQAIRIAINDELTVFEKVLPTLLPTLAIGGRLAVITFHSLEDRLLKKFIRQYNSDNLPPKMPIPESQRIQPPIKIVNFKIKPTVAELDVNPRSRSATLRVVEKVNENTR